MPVDCDNCQDTGRAVVPGVSRLGEAISAFCYKNCAASVREVNKATIQAQNGLRETDTQRFKRVAIDGAHQDCFRAGQHLCQ